MHWYTVELRITGVALDPREVTARLGITPTQVRFAGEPRGRGEVWTKSLWAYSTPVGSSEKQWDSLEDGLSCVLNEISHRKIEILSYTATCDVIWWCGHFQSSFNGGPSFSANLLRRLADFGAPVLIDSYHSEDE